MDTSSFSMFIPTKFVFGAGKLATLHSQQLPGYKAMIITTNGSSVIRNGSLEQVKLQLAESNIGYCVFNQVTANPDKQSVDAGAVMARENKCDFLIALGGGSVIDAAKAIAVMSTNEGDLWDYIVGGTGKGMTIPNKPLPIVAIPTTSGTGSEADCGGVITNTDTNEKKGIVNPDLFPVLSIVDPVLTESIPPIFTALQGFDALFHSTEGYISNCANMLSDMFQERAISNVGKYLARACENGTDIEAREHMAFASTLSGFSMVTSACTAEHSIEHAMSAYHPNLPHGAGLIIISTAYYNKIISQHVCDSRFVDMARWLGFDNATKPEDFITALENLKKACGVENLKMSDYGITPAEFETLALNAQSVMGGLIKCDHQPLNTKEIVAILAESYK